MIPILYETTEREFTTNGLGYLPDTAKCTVTEERNGKFELEMEYPVSGRSFSDIKERRIIFAKPSPGRRPQPFRIYRIAKNSKNTVKVYAEHISYDLAGVPVSAFSAETAAEAIAKLNASALAEHPFIFETDKERDGSYNNSVPAGIRSIMGGQEGSLLDIYHGEWLYDMFTVSLKEARGADNGVNIAYGKNITTLEQDENIANVYTGVLPYWYSEEQGLAQGTIQQVPGTFDYVRILTQDFSDKFQEPPTDAELNAEAAKYIRDNDIGVPKVSLKVSFVDLAKANGLETVAFLENVELCDTVSIRFEALNISTKAKIVKTEYNVLLDRYTSVEIGDARETLADTIASQNSVIKNATKKSDLEKAVANATKLITGNSGGYVVFHDSDGDSFPDEILVMDKPTIEEATKIWRWNQQGLGYSGTGYQGPYGLAMTIDGGIVADFITTGTLNADSVNVSNINGENIKGKTIGNAQLASSAADSRVIGGGSVGSGHLTWDVNDAINKGVNAYGSIAYGFSVLSAGYVYADNLVVELVNAHWCFKNGMYYLGHY